MQKRGQAAMEFLMTYGWAILIVLVALSALFYLGVFDSDDSVTTTCQLPAPLTCQSAKIDEKGVTLEVGLLKGFSGTITQIEVNSQPCTEILNGALSEGKITIVRCTKSGLVKGDNPVITVKADTSKISGGVPHAVEGTIQGSTEKFSIAGYPSIVAAYSFEDNANDVSGNGNNAVMQGTVPFVSGKTGKAASFDGGAVNYFKAPISSKLNITTEMSISAWLNPILTPEATPKDKAAIDTRNKTTTKGGFALKIFPPKSGGGGDTRNVFFGANQKDGTKWLNEGIVNGLVQGQWHHFVATFGAGEVKVYLDGVPKGTYPTTVTDITTVGTDLYIGRYVGGDAGYNYNGAIDEVYIFNRVLSLEEIQVLASN